MKYRIEITRQAEQDLRGIYEYIAFSLLSPQHALGQLERLEKQIKNLDYMPERFRLYEKEPWHSRGLRLMPVDSFIVFYLKSEEIVTIIRIMYDGRDIDEELKKFSNR